MSEIRMTIKQLARWCKSNRIMPSVFTAMIKNGKCIHSVDLLEDGTGLLGSILDGDFVAQIEAVNRRNRES